MGASVKTYKPSDVVVVVSGYQLTGIVSLTAQWSSPPYTTIKGIRGTNTRVRNYDSGLTLILQILQTSITNDVLSEIVSKDISTGNGRLHVQIKDSSGSTLLTSTNGFVSNRADVAYSNDLSEREWRIEMLNTSFDSVVGGNAKVGPSMLDQALNFFGF